MIIRLLFSSLITLVLISCQSTDKTEIDLYLEKANTYKAEITRDTWGVPHVYGKTDADAAFGLAYAHAEDDFKTIQDIMLALKGSLAIEYGKDAAPNDYMVQLLKIWEVVENGYSKDLSKEVQEICEAYADGLNHYALLHQNEVIRGMFPVE